MRASAASCYAFSPCCCCSAWWYRSCRWRTSSRRRPKKSPSATSGCCRSRNRFLHRQKRAQRWRKPRRSFSSRRRNPGRRNYKPTRTDEEIQLVFDRNKGSIFGIYNRALRDNAALQGRMVLRLTIAPSGEVTRIGIISSELGDSELERRLLQRIKAFDFGAKDVDTVTVTYPIHFFPS